MGRLLQGCVGNSFRPGEQRHPDRARKAFSQTWTADNIGTAPQPIAEVAEGLGGLRPSQVLFTQEIPNGAVLIGAWWPWANGQTVSLRIAAYADGEGEAALVSQVRKAFDLS